MLVSLGRCRQKRFTLHIKMRKGTSFSLIRIPAPAKPHIMALRLAYSDKMCARARSPRFVRLLLLDGSKKFAP